jgi:hypothetical protein
LSRIFCSMVQPGGKVMRGIVAVFGASLNDSP